MEKSLFTDQQLFEATDLHMANVKRLITWGAVRPAKGGKGRGRVRLWEARAIRHIACVAALIKTGMSLRTAHTIAYLDIAGELFLDLTDPETHALNGVTDHRWFDPNTPLDPDDDLAFRLYIVDGQYLFTRVTSEGLPMPKGVLANDLTVFQTFVDWGTRGKTIMTPEGAVWAPKWEIAPGVNEVEPESLAWEHDPSLDQGGRVDWQQTWSSAVSVTTVNLTFACVLAMRRLFGIPLNVRLQPIAGDKEA